MTLYIIENRVKISGRYIYCHEVSDSYDTMIDDLWSGQFDEPIKIIQVIVDESSSRDVSEDVARDLLAKAHRDNETIPEFLVAYLQEQIGVTSIPAVLIAAE